MCLDSTYSGLKTLRQVSLYLSDLEMNWTGVTNFGQTKFGQDVLPSLVSTNFGQHQVWPDFVFKVGGGGGGGGFRVRAVRVGACPGQVGPGGGPGEGGPSEGQEGWGTKGGPRRRGPKFRAFFPSPATFFFLPSLASLGSLHVEFWWCF